MKTWFTSDPHFGHVNIIAYSNRPFRNVDEMNEVLIRNWNSVVSEKDEVWVLGDVCMGRLNKVVHLLGRLKGRKYLIAGNHDKKARKMDEFKQHFVWIKDYYETTIYDPVTNGKTKVVMSHYPMASWNKMHHGSIMVHGHCHNTLPVDSKLKRIDVGVDAHNYFPISSDHLKGLADKLVFKPVDHHGQR
jgi:calcineurin-like phosphoesterase family protein